MVGERLLVPDGLPEPVQFAIGDAVAVARFERGPATTTFVLESKTGWPFRVLNVSDRSNPFAVLSELDRLNWLDRRLPVPKLLASAPLGEGGHATVLALPPGSTAAAPDNPHPPARTVELFAQALRFVHEIPIDKCPFSTRVELRLRSIRRKITAGQYNDVVFSEAYRRYPITRLFEILSQNRPAEEDLVFAHGAWSLDAVYVDTSGVTGIVNWDRAGVADRYADLAMAAKAIADRITPELIPHFFECYGLPRPDPLRLDYYQLLAEFP